jgi:hypothetical protein
MSQKKEILANLIALVVAVVLIGGVIGLLKILSGPGGESSNPPATGSEKTGTSALTNGVRERISQHKC